MTFINRGAYVTVSGETVGFVLAILGIIGYIVKMTTDYTRLKEEVKNLKEKVSFECKRYETYEEKTKKDIEEIKDALTDIKIVLAQIQTTMGIKPND